MVDVLNRSRQSDTVTIDAKFLRRQARTAIAKFFKPVTVVFEPAALKEPAGKDQMTASHLLPKPGRVQMRGYAMRKRGA